MENRCAQRQSLDTPRALWIGTRKLTIAPIVGSLHFAMIDQPERVNNALASYLASLK